MASPATTDSLSQSTLQTGAVHGHSSKQSTESKKPLKPLVRVLITGAAGNLAYSAAFMAASGQMLGDNQPVHLLLLDIPGMEKQLEGLCLELEDCSYPLLRGMTPTVDYKTAFTDIDYALLIGAKPRGPGMQRKDLLTANAAIFSGQGKALNQYAKRTVKVLVVGNPANTNALITMTNAPDIPKTNFSALTRLDANRARGLLATRLNVSTADVRNIIIWGNHSATQYPAVNHAVVVNRPYKGATTPVRAAVNDNDYLNEKFIKVVQERGAQIIGIRGKSSAASAAWAAIDHMRDWALGTPPGQYASMAVYADGTTYGVPEGLIFSFPCVCQNGRYSIVKGLPMDEFSKKKMKTTTDELLEERATALGK